MEQIVRSNKNSPKDRRKCSTEFHNQPKMAIAQKQQQQQQKDEQQGVKKAKDFLFTSLRHHRRKISNTKMSHDVNDVEGHTGEAKEETEHPSMQKLVMYDASPAVASSFKSNSNNRKSTPDYKNEATCNAADQPNPASVEGVATTFCYDNLQRHSPTIIQQCHCITCFKSDKVALANSTAMTSTTECATLNKYVLRISSQGQLGERQVLQEQRQNEEKFHSYQCPTGKLCCLNVNVLLPSACTSASRGTNFVTNINNQTTTAATKTRTNNIPLLESMTNNNLSTRTTNKAATATAPRTNDGNMKRTVLASEQHQQQQQQKHQLNGYKFQRILKNEWDILAHLTEDHKLPVYQYYAEYGQAIPIQCLGQQNSITCLNLKGTGANVTEIEKFFLSCVPLEMPHTTAADVKVAIFLYHINTAINDSKTITTSNSSAPPIDEVSNFETIIENPLTGIKWFGRAHPLTTPWSHILEKQHFFRHNVRRYRTVAVSSDEAAVSGGDDAIVTVFKMKN